ncbi:MAG: ATP-binding protein [Candidatus Heimdallarchaeaceae archaeon]
MEWIVIGEEKGAIKLVSKSGTPGLLPKGSYLTIERDESKFILRVDDSKQYEPYNPSPMIVDMDLSPMQQDGKCQNIIYANRVKDLNQRDDGLIDYIPPQSTARRSNQEEINLAIGASGEGPEVFVATVHTSQNQILIDNEKKLITANLPIDMFFHQILICGKTGSGKTVASKYLAQYFIEELEGAVLAINVKDVDFLKMDKKSVSTNPNVKLEWKELNQVPHGIDNYTIYFPANINISTVPGITRKLCQNITLNVKEIEPESLTGLLRGITDIAAQNLPNIFRFWQEDKKSKNDDEFSFGEFVEYFARAERDNRIFRTMNSRKEESAQLTLHSSTYNNVLRNLMTAQDFFDNPDAKSLDWDDILSPGKMSVINVAGQKGVEFGSVLLRHLLNRIVNAKSFSDSSVPILIIIDEVHQFYNTESSKDALGDLDTICRTGRSQEIGVIFSSQNPQDVPRGLGSVINTKIFFKSDAAAAKTHGLKITTEEIENLQKGYAATSIHDLSKIKFVKFPLSYAGVFEKEVKN